MNNHRRNIDRIKAVSRAFGKLKEDIVFVGGALYLYTLTEWQKKCVRQ